jgi:hypothetical protein
LVLNCLGVDRQQLCKGLLCLLQVQEVVPRITLDKGKILPTMPLSDLLYIGFEFVQGQRYPEQFFVAPPIVEGWLEFDRK